MRAEGELLFNFSQSSSSEFLARSRSMCISEVVSNCAYNFSAFG